MISKGFLSGILMAFYGLFILAGQALAGDPVEGKNNPVNFSGTVWAKYSYLVEDLPTGEAENTDANGFAIDRVYLTFSSKLGDRFVGRARLEANNVNNGSSEIFLKLADVTVHKPIGIDAASLRFGQTPGAVTPFLESIWGYRVLSKVTTDRYLGISSTYLGAGVEGHWLDGILDTDLLIANRVAYSKNVKGDGEPKYKTFAGRVLVHPIQEGPAKGLAIGGYGQIAPKMSPSSDNQALWYGGHAFYKGEVSGHTTVVGLQYDSRTDKAQGIDPTDSLKVVVNETTAAVLSGFARVGLTDRVEVFGRVDMFDPDTDEDDVTYEPATEGLGKSAGQFESLGDAEKKLARTILMAGVSHAYTKTVRGIIDVSIRMYDDDLFIKESGSDPLANDYDNEIIVSARLEANL